MVALLIRRLLWLIPTLFVVSLLLFLLFSFVPEDAGHDATPLLRDPQAEARAVRARFGDLPRFFNRAPEDVRSRSLRAAERVAADGPDAAEARAELCWLGGAALPHLIPSLDQFDPEARARVAVALHPVALRMGLLRADDARDPDRAVAFWSRFWADRSVEFRPASVRTAVERLARYRTPSRATELAQLDTFALAAILAKLAPPTDAESTQVARTLIDVAAHVTGRDDVIADDATLAEARAVVARWHRFWLVYESDFVAFSGTTRAAAALRETRYGKWALGIVLSVTVERDATRARLTEVLRALPVTLTLVFGGIALAYVSGAALGTAAAISRRRLPRAIAGTAIVALHAMPTATLAVLLIGLAPERPALWFGVLLVALGLLASPAQKQRDALSGVFARDFARAAQARGATRTRAIVTQGLRQGLLGSVALVSVEPPATLGAAFVAEQVLGLPGLGALTVAAVADRDVTFLMGLVIGCVLVASMLLFVSDVIQSSLDPRLRARVGGRSA